MRDLTMAEVEMVSGAAGHNYEMCVAGTAGAFALGGAIIGGYGTFGFGAGAGFSGGGFIGGIVGSFACNYFFE